MATHTHPEIKRVGDTGQVSVGKALAGKLVRMEPVAGGIMLRFVVDVAESEAWWLQEPYKSKLKDALSWAKDNAPAETDLKGLLARATEASKAGPPLARRTRAKRPPAKTKKK